MTRADPPKRAAARAAASGSAPDRDAQDAVPPSAAVPSAAAPDGTLPAASPGFLRSRRRRLLAAALCGVGLTLAQPPVFLWPLVFLCVPALAWLALAAAPRREAFGIGWAAGTGFFLTGLYWVAEAFLVDIARHGWMAPFAIGGLAAGLGLFWALPFWIARRLCDWRDLAARPFGGLRATLVLAILWTGAEYARAHVLTGFPWALPAYVWAETPVAQTLALFGPHGLSLLTLAFAAALAAPWIPPSAGARLRRRRALACLAAALIALAGGWGFGAWRLDSAPPLGAAPAEAIQVRLVQPDARQAEKWDPAKYQEIFARLRALSGPQPDMPVPDVVIWPETAVPWILEREPRAREIIAQAADGAQVLVGARRIEEIDGIPRWRNGLVALSPSGEIEATYDKRHLVPFGEYLPFHETLTRLGLGPMVGESGGFSAGTGPGRMEAPGLPPMAPQICYETIFPDEQPSAAPGVRPDWIVQVTNDAWFGTSAGPWQHFHQARMRAIEQGLPLARAANTGISAMIDPYGRVVDWLGLQQAGFVQAALPAPLPPTPFARLTGAAWLPGLVGLLLAGLAAGLLFIGPRAKDDPTHSPTD